jgi:hypothetical protein
MKNAIVGSVCLEVKVVEGETNDKCNCWKRLLHTGLIRGVGCGVRRARMVS